MRVDFYTLIHKAQRFHLYLLSNRMSRSAFKGQGEIASITFELRALVEHLRAHAIHEETYIHPLYRRLGLMGEHLAGEHQAIELQLDELERLARERRWPELYPTYNRLLARYIAHLDEEERAQATILWPNYTDEELATALDRFKAGRAPEDARADLEFMLPALSVPELSGMFHAMMASVPREAFLGACEIAAESLEDTTWRQVASNVGLSTPP